MRFILIMAMALALVTSAGAEPRHGDRGWRDSGRSHSWPERPYWNRPDPLGSIIGGAIGGFLWRQFNDPQPNEPIVQTPPPPDEAWCVQRYKSYDPYTKTYLGFDGLRHGCP